MQVYGGSAYTDVVPGMSFGFEIALNKKLFLKVSFLLESSFSYF
jgi:hypothetical protein